MITKIVNLSPHPLTICPSGGEVINVPSSGEVRCIFTPIQADRAVLEGYEADIPIYQMNYSRDVIGLDLIKDEPDTIYYVSRHVAEAIRLYYPDKYKNLCVSNQKFKDPTSGKLIYLRSLMKV